MKNLLSPQDGISKITDKGTYATNSLVFKFLANIFTNAFPFILYVSKLSIKNPLFALSLIFLTIVILFIVLFYFVISLIFRILFK